MPKEPEMYKLSLKEYISPTNLKELPYRVNKMKKITTELKPLKKKSKKTLEEYNDIFYK